MSDAEDDVVLVAPVPRLMWREQSFCWWVGTGADSEWSYTVLREPGVGGQFICRFDNGGNPHFYPALVNDFAGAQAVCENHFVTGQWDGQGVDVHRFRLVKDAREWGTYAITLLFRHDKKAEWERLTAYLMVRAEDAPAAEALFVKKLEARGWTRQNLEEFRFHLERAGEVVYLGFRRVCLLCGNVIEGRLVTQTTLAVRVEREGMSAVYGDVHASCLGERAPTLDLTGYPDYSGFNKSYGKLPFPDGYDAVRGGLAMDALCRQEWLRREGARKTEYDTK